MFDIREAWATVQPYSVARIAYAESFLFQEGVLCYLDHYDIRALSVRQSASLEQVIDVELILRENRLYPSPEDKDDPQLQLLYYGSGVVTCLCEFRKQELSYLLAVDVISGAGPGGRKPLRTLLSLRSTSNIFARNDGSVLFYGTNPSSTTSRNHHEWLVKGIDLHNNQKITETPVQLKNFVGYEIGCTVCFEIHQGFFYAISSQTGDVDEEVDWTSYYTCMRFPVNDPQDIEWRRIWRRQPRLEGPIHDGWTNISLQVDESTKELMIVECRREWHLTGTGSSRAYYFQPLNCFDSTPTSHSTSDCSSLADGDLVVEAAPVDTDPLPPFHSGVPEYAPVSLTTMLDGYSKPNYEPPKKRTRHYYHTEYPLKEIPPNSELDFKLVKTKFQAYNYSASAHIDLVSDPLPSCKAKSNSIPSDRLRLRIGSRKQKCPIDEEGKEGDRGYIYPPEQIDEDGVPIEFSEERFESRGIHLWPPSDAPDELFSLLCPGKRCENVHAVSDERSLVYFTDAGKLADGRRPIILISFDPRIRLSNFRRLGMSPSATRTNAPVDMNIEEAMTAGKGVKRSLPPDPAASLSHSAMPLSQRPRSNTKNHSSRIYNAPSWFRLECAMYLSINESYWLR